MKMEMHCNGHELEVELKAGEFVFWENSPIWCNLRIFEHHGEQAFFIRRTLAKENVDTLIEKLERLIRGECIGKSSLWFGEEGSVEGEVEDPRFFSPLHFEFHGYEDHHEDCCYLMYGEGGSMGNSGAVSFSLGLNRYDCEDLRKSLLAQMAEIDWEECGKTEYLRIKLPDNPPCRRCYSAAQLEEELKPLCVGKKLRSVLISAENYMDAQEEKQKEAYWCNFDGAVLLVFDTYIVDLAIGGEGLFHYRVIPMEAVEMMERCYGRIPYIPPYSDEVYISAAGLFDGGVENEDICEVRVDSTEYCWFGETDTSLCNDPIELPLSISLKMENGRTLHLVGDDIEYFDIRLK